MEVLRDGWESVKRFFYGRSGVSCSTTTRQVYANQPEKNQGFCDNRVSNTKYSLVTFLPKNLLEQFSRHYNRYFLLIACLQLWDTITPVDPLTTWGPLLVIFTISAVKEGVDDFWRYKADKRANLKEYWVVKDGSKTRTLSESIRVGDIVYVQEDEEFPCDVMLLTSSDSTGACFIQSSNLDGEADLKARQSLPETMTMTTAEIYAFKGVVECSPPNPAIYQFDSALRLFPTAPLVLSVTSQQILLQGCFLRNTDWVYGLVVYTGNETKLGQNKRDPPTKWTKIDKYINRVTIALFMFQLGVVLCLGMTGEILRTTMTRHWWYLSYPSSASRDTWYEWMVIPLRFLLLCSLFIPISLKVTLDVCKYFYAWLINWDVEMYDEETDEPAHATSTAISEDLGQVEYIFSDKTGTLTENSMIFRKCSIEGVLFGHSIIADNAIQDARLRDAVAQMNPGVLEFLRCLAMCNTILPSARDKGRRSYRGASPDEEALVRAAARFNVILSERDSNVMSVLVEGMLERYEILHILEFTSLRRCMSVIVRNTRTGKITLYCKGSDDSLIPRVADNCFTEATVEHLEAFAELGLRTLVIMHRDVEEEEFRRWKCLLMDANTAIDDREARVAGVYRMLESNMHLLGATAIEDRLQEHVSSTIRLLRSAGIRFWMLTGDKYATAVQIARSCYLLSSDPNSIVFRVTGHSPGEVEIHSPVFARNRRSSFTAGCKGCEGTGPLCLAIGDGGNDVSMIQEADVGVGIAGKEGRQAARAADYSIGKFHFLRRLLLIHGRYSYYRTAFIAQYCFYKSIFISLIQLSFAAVSGFSGTSFFNSFSLMCYNVLFTGLPIFFFVLDKDLSEEGVVVNPQLYREAQRNCYMNFKSMVMWCMRALFQAVAVITITLGVYGVGYAGGDAKTIDYESTSMVVYSCAIWIQTLTMIIESNHLTVWNHIVIWGTWVCYHVVIIIANALPQFSLYFIMFRLLGDVRYWFTMILATVVSLGPIFAYKYYVSRYAPDTMELARLKERDALRHLPLIEGSRDPTSSWGTASNALMDMPHFGGTLAHLDNRRKREPALAPLLEVPTSASAEERETGPLLSV